MSRLTACVNARRRLRSVAAVVIAGGVMVGAIPAGASAATVRISFAPSEQWQGSYGPPPSAASLSFAAAPGEANDVTVTGVRNGYEIRDAGATIGGDPGFCSNADAYTLTCVVPVSSAGVGRRSGFEHASFSLGDEADVFRGIDVSGYSGDGITRFVVDGGSGNDQLSAGSARGVVLIGGPGDDRVIGGPGDDTIVGGPGHDIFDGGGGTNTLDLSYARLPVMVDLRRGIARTRGEDDRIAHIQHVIGGAGNDTLIAGAGTVVLDDGAGHNTLVGGSGKTTLYGSSAGNRLVCGRGPNVVAEVTARDLVGERCRTIEPRDSLGESFRSRLPLRSLSAAVAALDRYVCVDPSCTLTLRLRIAPGAPRHRDALPGALIGQRQVVLRRDGATVRNVAITLSPSGTRLLARDGALRVTVSFSTTDAGGPPFSRGAYTTTLRRPG